MAISVSFPLSLATGSLGYLESTDDVVSALQSNVRSLLLTNRTERVMHATLGCGLNEFIFEPMTAATFSNVAARITGQLSQWLPYLNVAGIFFATSDDDGSVPDPGFRVTLNLTYGNVPFTVSATVPPTGA